MAEDAKSPAEIWTWLNFAILVGVLGYLIAKHMGPMLTTRTRQIQEGLAAGEKAKAEAAARGAAVQSQLANLGAEVAKLRASAAEDREREANRIKREAESELARIQQHATQEIESAGKLASLELRHHAASMAIELAERKLRARMSPEIQASLLQNFSGDLSEARSKAPIA